MTTIIRHGFGVPATAARATPDRRLSELIKRIPERVAVWQARARTRSQLRALLAHSGDHLLKDIGVSRAAALYELNKPFWKP